MFFATYNGFFATYNGRVRHLLEDLRFLLRCLLNRPTSLAWQPHRVRVALPVGAVVSRVR